jgi:hypothetical protein
MEKEPRDLAEELVNPYNPENFKHKDRDGFTWLKIGQRDERNYNQWQALASYELAEKEGASARKDLIRKSARENASKGFLMLNDSDSPELYKYVRERADEQKLELLRDYIDKL